MSGAGKVQHLAVPQNDPFCRGNRAHTDRQKLKPKLRLYKTKDADRLAKYTMEGRVAQKSTTLRSMLPVTQTVPTFINLFTSSIFASSASASRSDSGVAPSSAVVEPVEQQQRDSGKVGSTLQRTYLVHVAATAAFNKCTTRTRRPV